MSAPLRSALHISAALAALTLAACGGSGSGGPSSSPAPTPLPENVPAPAPTPPPPVPPAPAPAPAPVPPPPPPTGTNFNTDEYRRSNAAVASGAIDAWKAGASGSGVKLAVIDSGISPSLNEFAGRIDPASTDVAGNRGISDEGGHGSAVTAIAAAARNDNQIVGIAYNATILSYRSDGPGSCARTGTDEGCSHNDGDIAEGIDLARVAGARVINLSLGGSPPTQQLVQAVGRATAAGIVIVVSAGNEREKEPAKGGNPNPFALGLVNGAPGGLVIIAGSIGVDIDGSSATRDDIDLTKLSAFSNQAGSGAQSYLSALGFRVVAPNITDGNKLYLYSGTSFSAPVISGAVALLAGAFPNLTGKQIVDLLYRTANDLGDPGIDAIFGHGALNLTRAFQPQGQTVFAGSGTPVSLTSNGALPAASGDARTGAVNAVILDDYDRAFDVDLAGTVRRARTPEPLAGALGNDLLGGTVAAGAVSLSLTTARLRDQPVGIALAQQGLSHQDSRRARLIAGMAAAQISDRTAIAMGFSEGGKALEKRLAGVSDAPFMIARDPHGTIAFDLRRGNAVALRHQLGRIGLTVTAERGQIEDTQRLFPQSSGFNAGTLTADTQVGPARLALSASRMREDSTVLGGRFDASLGAPGATSWLVDGVADAHLGGGWSATARYRRGWTGFGSAGAGGLSTDGFAFDLGKTNLLRSGDRLGLRFAQPLRVRSGGLSLMLPVRYSYATLATEYAPTLFNLAPEGRELDFEAAYGVSLAGGWLGANAFLRRQPGHIAAADDDIGAAVRFTLGF